MLTFDDLTICYSLALEVVDMDERMARLRSIMESPTSQRLTGMPSGGNQQHDRNAEMLIQLEQIAADNTRRKMAYLGHIRLVEAAIAEIGNPLQRIVLKQRYIDGSLWDDIGRKNYMSARCAQTYAKRGLRALGIIHPAHKCVRTFAPRSMVY